ncbi:Uncharacterized protein FWK35_00016671 [Aphis craccivora]|uniref:Uncharacterized protein n=1 Tax=Aphis craccivora TaxID=307492 RepID=A0A6G0YA77_APHCR|nr:Uncharacterized protein FWK35_00016671 [Aphis craccivora]
MLGRWLYSYNFCHLWLLRFLLIVFSDSNFVYLSSRSGIQFNSLIGDEAYFQFSEYVNKQNCQIWGNENPRVSMEKQMHPQRVTVGSEFWAGRVITKLLRVGRLEGPYARCCISHLNLKSYAYKHTINKFN